LVRQGLLEYLFCSMKASPKQGTFDRIIAGLASTFLYHIIAAAHSILLVPLFLRAWGTDGYGNWLVLTAFVSYLGLLDLGGQNYIGNLLAFDNAQGDEIGFRRRFSEGLSLFSLISVASFLLLVAALTLPTFPLPGRDVYLSGAERGVLLFMGGAVLVSIPQGIFVTVYRATGQLYTGTMVGNGMRFLFLLLYAGVLLAGGSPVLYAFSYFLAAVLLTLVIVWHGYRTIPQCSGVRLSFSAAREGKRHLGGAIFFWMYALAAAINLQGVIIVLGVFASPAAVALYATHRTASGLLGHVGNLFMASTWPDFSFAYAEGEKEKLARMALLTVRAVVFMSAVAAVALWVLLPEIYPLWTAKRLGLQPWLMALFLAQGILAAGWSTAGWVLLASNEHRTLAWWALANAGLTVTMAVLLAPRYGIFGVAAATLLGDLVCGALVYPRMAARHLGISASQMFRAIFRPVLAVVPAGVLVLLCSTLKTPVWTRALVGAVVAAALLYPSALLAFGRSDWSMLAGRLRHIATGVRT